MVELHNFWSPRSWKRERGKYFKIKINILLFSRGMRMDTVTPLVIKSSGKINKKSYYFLLVWMIFTVK
jgi:hypothetical protein